jgi:hypothetical protein
LGLAQRPSCAFPNEKLQAAQIVLSAEKFYDYADEHFGWAETARTDRERALFLQMAAAWLEVAQRWETSAKRRAPHSLCEHRSDGGGGIVPPAWRNQPLSRQSGCNGTERG